MELVFVGPPLFLSTVAIVLPNAKTEPWPVERLLRDDTAFVCPMDPDGLLADPVYDSKAMFRGVQTNLTKTVQRLGYTDSQDEPHLPTSSALGVSVWGSSWLIGSVIGDHAFRDRSSAASDAFLAAYIVACSLPGVKRLVCPPLCVRPGRLSYQTSAAQIARVLKNVGDMPQQAAVTPDSRGVQSYLAIY